MLREAARLGTDTGLRAATYMKAGKLVPDEMVCGMLVERIEEPDCAHGCILDGFPRTEPQAEMLDEYLVDRGMDPPVAIEIAVEEAELMKRLASRGRSDDDEAVIRHRLRQYEALTRPLLDYYRGRGVLHSVDGHGAPDEIFLRITEAVEAFTGS